MIANDLEQLGARLAKLEASNRRLSQFVVVLLVVLASAVWMGQGATKTPRKKAAAPAAPKVIEAEQFVLKTASGKVLATLGMTDNGPALRLVGPNGSDRALLGLDATGTPRLAMMRADGSQPITVALTPAGVPQIEVTAPNKSKVRLTVGSEGPGIGLVDPGGLVRMALDLKPDGPLMALVDKDKVTRASFNSTDKGPNIVLFDENAQSRITMSVRPGQAAFGIQDSKGETRAGLEVRADNPALALYGPNGKPLFEKR